MILLLPFSQHIIGVDHPVHLDPQHLLRMGCRFQRISFFIPHLGQYHFKRLSAGAEYFVKKNLNELLELDPSIDTIILGCTHYPLIIPVIEKFLPPHIKLLAQGSLVAQSLSDYLKRHPEMALKCSTNGVCTYMTTESTEKFNNSASIFLKETIEAVHLVL